MPPGVAVLSLVWHCRLPEIYSNTFSVSSALATLAAARGLPSPARAYGTGSRAREEACLAVPLALFERRFEAVFVYRLPLSDSCQLGRRMQAEVTPKYRRDVRRGSAESQPKGVGLAISRLLRDVRRPTPQLPILPRWRV